jgi:hypothetical protein
MTEWDFPRFNDLLRKCRTHASVIIFPVASHSLDVVDKSLFHPAGGLTCGFTQPMIALVSVSHVWRTQMKKPDLLVLIAIWQFITAFFALIGIAAIGVFAFPAVLGYWDGYGWGMMGRGYDMPVWGGVFGLSVAILVLLCYLALAVDGGIGLMLGKGHEWARIVTLVHNALSLFAIPIGTVIGTLSIIYLTKQEVRDYFNPPPPPAA